MNVSITRGGGMAGIATRTQLASDALPKAEGRRLRELASALAPAASASGPAYPDETLYRIDVDGVTAVHTETSLPDAARALIDYVSERPERQDGILKRPL